MSVTLSIDERNFSAMLKELDTTMDVKGGFQEIIMNEVRSVLIRATKETKKASKKSIRRRVISTIPNKNSRGWYKPAPQSITDTDTSTGARGRGWRIKDHEWKAYLRYKREQVKEMSQRAGLSAQTWVQIGKVVGVNVKAPAYVINAKRGGSPVRHRITGTQKRFEKKSASVVLHYQNPSGRWARARPALQSAIRGRTQYFKTNLATGAFNNARRAAAKYKGVEVKRTF